MRNWMKWLLLVAVVTLPAIGYAVKVHRAAACPVTPDCPCEHGR